MRAVVDTNVWVSSFIAPHGPSAAILAALIAGRFEAVFIVSGDHDVRLDAEVQRFVAARGIRTLSARAFLAELG